MSNTRFIFAQERSVIDLREYIRDAAHPILCLGPMSVNCVESVIRVANRLKRPIPLIASRRQIDCEAFGGGYVNRWNTRSFAQYVHARDLGYVPLCRDHGGPWQGNGEADLDDKSAMERAKESMLEDITCGFDLIHIDPSLRGGSPASVETVEKICELYSFVVETAARLGRRIEIEIGAEQQSGHFSEPEELVSLLKQITKFCQQRGFQKPLFCVVQTGTLVKEMRNVGLTEGRKNESYDQKYAVENIGRGIKYLSDIAYINGVYIKEHNGDYLSDGSMAFRTQLQVGGINIAPELGVFESKCLVSLCLELGLDSLLQEMLTIFHSTRKWEKWLSENSVATDLDKAIIAGHYAFSTPAFLEVKEKLAHIVREKENIDLDEYLIGRLSSLVTRLLWNAGYYQSVGEELSKIMGETLQPCQSSMSISTPSLDETCQVSVSSSQKM